MSVNSGQLLLLRPDAARSSEYIRRACSIVIAFRSNKNRVAVNGDTPKIIARCTVRSSKLGLLIPGWIPVEDVCGARASIFASCANYNRMVLNAQRIAEQGRGRGGAVGMQNRLLRPSRSRPLENIDFSRVGP